MIEFEIDGKLVQAEPGSMIIAAADKVGIYIPRFCYHKKLSIAANCRMCLVEVEKSPKPLPACATPITAGMKVYTQSAKTKEAQRSVMEFLLINHPLDCPICDQGGECELQDLSLSYGKDVSRFNEGKRAVEDDDLGPLIATEMTRCIHCTRCVRFGQEVAGIRELGATGRGEHMQITTYVKHSMESELSGNIIDLCPVGALTSKPFRFRARAWELQQYAAIAPHDCVGSNIYIHTRNGDVMRVVPRENEAINETWISDRDRFSYTGLKQSRLHKPRIKVNGQWQEVNWPTALDCVASGLHQILTQYGPHQIAGIISPNATLEEFYLWQKLLRDLNCANIDHRLRQTDFTAQDAAPLFPHLEISLQALEKQQLVFLIGSDIQREQPLASVRVRKATLKGGRVLSINVVDYPFNFPQTQRLIVPPLQIPHTLAALVKILAQQTHGNLSDQELAVVQDIQPNAQEIAFARQLMQATPAVILLGAVAHNHPQAALINWLAHQIAKLIDAKLGILTEGANSAGAWLAGALPHRGAAGDMTVKKGLTASEAFTANLKSYLLFNVEPHLDCANPYAATTALQNAEQVVVFTPFISDYYLQHANVLLPIAAFSETPGTYINVEGCHQAFIAAVALPTDNQQPGWRALALLAQQLSLQGYDYRTIDQLQETIATLSNSIKEFTPATWLPEKIQPAQNPALTKITEWPIYSSDSLVRRAWPLQQAANNPRTALYINPQTAVRLQLKENKYVHVKQQTGTARLPVKMMPELPENCVWIPGGREQSAQLTHVFGAIDIYAE